MIELIKAVKDERMQEIFKLISAGADVNEADDFGKSPLHYALNVQVVKLLISSGAEVNAKDKHGKTPLDYAPNARIVKVLEESGGIRTVSAMFN
ncbi:MAG: ankyrin repeat domain-containing protein [Lentisphaeraceae bacterium]|nr:ankyrin repeat domain-containing protein [Lentisphaeraceae bacterium]